MKARADGLRRLRAASDASSQAGNGGARGRWSERSGEALAAAAFATGSS
jgi:hypothetical protein